MNTDEEPEGFSGGNMNQPPKKPRTEIDFYSEVDGLSSQEVAENLKTFFNLDASKEENELHCTMISYFNLEAEILPMKYTKADFRTILDACSDAVENRYMQKLISACLEKRIILSQKQKCS
jgi:hypothetical protein